MTSIRAFIISSSMLLTVWLAASYATRLDQNKPAPTAQQPAVSAEVTVNTTTEQDRREDSIARLR